MTNHVHLVVETPRANLGRFMHQVQTAYTVYFNHRHQRHGHLTQGRYGARLVEEDAYILKLSRYVHLNPVFIASMRRRPVAERLTLLRQYPWSSYPGYIGRSRRLAFVDYAPILAMMSPDASRQARTYRRFVEAGDCPPNASSPWCVRGCGSSAKRCSAGREEPSTALLPRDCSVTTAP